MRMEGLAIFTIGHSTRDLAEFEKILLGHSISLLVDIRTIPRSRHTPQFNREGLEKALPRLGIGYLHMEELGGYRKASRDSINTAWRNASFRGYADYMQTGEFAAGIERLITLAKGQKTAIMCAEGNPFRCHRSLVADALEARGVKVMHISGASSASPHAMTKFALVKGKKVSYPKGREDAGKLAGW
ncbi:MAG: DUF488 domain-containing protein [Candidatus Micrarchaeia archaeon]